MHVEWLRIVASAIVDLAEMHSADIHDDDVVSTSRQPQMGWYLIAIPLLLPKWMVLVPFTFLILPDGHARRTRLTTMAQVYHKSDL